MHAVLNSNKDCSLDSKVIRPLSQTSARIYPFHDTVGSAVQNYEIV